MSEVPEQSKGVFIFVIVGSVIGTLLCVGCLVAGIYCLVRTIRPPKEVGISLTALLRPREDVEDSDLPSRKNI